MRLTRVDWEGVSPTVGVILMVAITVVLAVVVGVMVLDLGGSTSQNAQAGVTLEETSTGVEVEVNSFGESTEQLEVLVNGSVERTITSVGTYTVTASTDDVVSVRGTTGSGDSSVIQSVTVSSASASGGGGADFSTAPSDLSAVLSNMSGSGTSSDPYLITNVYELQAMSEDVSGHYKVMNDIDASVTSGWNGGSGFTPIGGDSNQFNGTLNGNGYTVTGLTINRGGEMNVGLFSIVGSSGSVNNIGVISVDIDGDGRVGGLVGRNNGGSISSAYVEGAVTGSSGVGGLIGRDDGGRISGSYASGTVTASGDYAGGLIAQTEGGRISGSYATGSVTGSSSVGGLLGSNGGGRVSDSYATGSVTGSRSVGGLVGDNDGRVETSYAAGNVTNAYTTSVGGLVGYNSADGSVSDSYWDTEATTQGSNGIGGGSGSVTNVNGLTTSEMTGSSASDSGNMDAFDWSSVWTTVTGEYPELR